MILCRTIFLSLITLYVQKIFQKEYFIFAQDTSDTKEVQQSLAEQTPSKKEAEPDTKDVKVHKENENNSKSDNESGDHDDDDDDYDDDEFPPVHIKLPLQFDFDEIAGVS